MPQVPRFAFLDPNTAYVLPRSFDFDDYIETEQELWALFPETEGKRVNFCQLGLTAQIYVETADDGSDLAEGETYFLMPCSDRTMRPVRMKPSRRLTLTEFRMTHLTAMKLMGKLEGTGPILDDVHMQVLGPEILGEA